MSREADGRWYATLATDSEAPDPLETTGRAVGVDLGITDFAVTSDGEKIANPRRLERKARNLARDPRVTWLTASADDLLDQALATLGSCGSPRATAPRTTS